MNELQRRIQRAAVSRGSTASRLQDLVANVVLSQMLPPVAVKGGTGIKLRLGEAMTRQTADLDVAFRGDRDAFLVELTANLRGGWGNFSGTVTPQRQRPPAGMPAAYVMQPYKVKLSFRGGPFATVVVELANDELGATAGPIELVMTEEATDLFAELGLQAPNPIPVLPVHHQIAQKLHACTEPGSQRAHDLVDLQLLADRADDALVADTTRRTFAYRRGHEWPAVVVAGKDWAGVYADAAAGLDVLADLTEAIAWTNSYIARIAAA